MQKAKFIYPTLVGEEERKEVEDSKLIVSFDAASFDAAKKLAIGAEKFFQLAEVVMEGSEGGDDSGNDGVDVAGWLTAGCEGGGCAEKERRGCALCFCWRGTDGDYNKIKTIWHDQEATTGKIVEVVLEEAFL